eukprot:g1333.t1
MLYLPRYTPPALVMLPIHLVLYLVASTAHVASNNADAFDKAKSDYKAADRELEAAIAFDDPSLRDKDVGRTTTTTTTTEAPIFNGNDDDAAADALALQTQQLVATTPAPAAPRPHVPAHDPAVVASLLRGLHARFEQSSLRYGSKVNVWRASGGYMGFRVAGNVPVRKERGVQFAHGDKKAQYSFGKVVPELFTLCSVTRSPAGDDGTVLVGSDEHWYHGHYGGESGVCRYGEAHKRDASADLFIARKDGWVVLCNSNDPAAGGGQGDQELLINSGIVGSVSPSAWDAADILIWKRVLTLGEMQQMTGYLHSRLDPTLLPLLLWKLRSNRDYLGEVRAAQDKLQVALYRTIEEQHGAVKEQRVVIDRLERQLGELRRRMRANQESVHIDLHKNVAEAEQRLRGRVRAEVLHELHAAEKRARATAALHPEPKAAPMPHRSASAGGQPGGAMPAAGVDHCAPYGDDSVESVGAGGGTLAFQPFNGKELLKMTPRPADILMAYGRWHRQQVARARAAHSARDDSFCRTAAGQIFVWYPLAGIGDNAMKLELYMQMVISRGLLLFVKEQTPPLPPVHVSWRDVQAPMPFPWDYKCAKQVGVLCGGAGAWTEKNKAASWGEVGALKLQPPYAPGMEPVARGRGLTRHDYSKWNILQNSGASASAVSASYRENWNSAVLPLLLMRYIMPSKAIEREARYRDMLMQLRGKFVIAIHVRTGKMENSRVRRRFGWHENKVANIAACARAMVAQLAPAAGKAKVLLLGDHAGVLKDLREQIGPVVVHETVEGVAGYIHDLKQAKAEGLDQEEIGRQLYQKSWQDYFLLRLANASLKEPKDNSWSWPRVTFPWQLYGDPNWDPEIAKIAPLLGCQAFENADGIDIGVRDDKHLDHDANECTLFARCDRLVVNEATSGLAVYVMWGPGGE